MAPPHSYRGWVPCKSGGEWHPKGWRLEPLTMTGWWPATSPGLKEPSPSVSEGLSEQRCRHASEVAWCGQYPARRVGWMYRPYETTPRQV